MCAFMIPRILALAGRWTALAALAAVSTTPRAPAQCPHEWAPGFEVPGVVAEQLTAMAVYDDGGGPALYVGGLGFSLACDTPVSGLARWDGTRWHKVGGGQVQALTVWDDGRGPALYVGTGSITGGGGLMRWDGQTWEPADPNVNLHGEVYALTVWDDGLGGGPALYVAGTLDIDGLESPCIAKWDGKQWTGLDGGVSPWWTLDAAVYALAVYDDGRGPKLYAAGDFAKAGGVPVCNIAAWDGAKWEVLKDDGVWGPDWAHSVYTLLPWDDGHGPSLFVGGDFEGAGWIETYGIARYDGLTWYDVGGGFDKRGCVVNTLQVFDGGAGPSLYAGGSLGNYYPITGLARWDGREWNQVGAGIRWSASALGVYDPPGAVGPGLYIGGPVTAGDLGVHGITRWDGQGFSNLGHGQGGAGGQYHGVEAAIEWDDGSGPALYVAGRFWAIGTTPAAGIARWNGTRWEEVMEGLSPSPNDVNVNAFAVFDDGSGPKLYAAGLIFHPPPEEEFTRLARWDGQEQGWTCLDHSPNNASGESLAVLDDGTGPALYMCGSFTDVDGVPVNQVARWDGKKWSALGSGLEGRGRKTLAVFDDGRGPALYVGGYLSKAGGVPVRNLARWDGEAWSDVGGGINQFCYALLSVERQGSKLLLVGGPFTEAGTMPVQGVAAWDGDQWHDISGGLKAPQKVMVRVLCEFDDAKGRAVYAGGSFTEPGQGFARWDGQRWTGLTAGGLSGGLPAQALAPSYSIQGASLFAGGPFKFAGERASVHIAQWRCVPGWKPGDTNCDGAVNFADINPFVLALLDKTRYETQFPDCLWVNADCNGDNAVNFADINPFLALLGRERAGTSTPE